MLKKLIITFAAVILTAYSVSSAVCAMPTAQPQVSAESALLIEASGGNVIYDKKSHDIRPMASTTKIMTALVTLEYCESVGRELDGEVKVNPSAVGIEGSSIYLKPDETLTLEALLYAMMLESANDAAAAIAMEIAGSIESFAVMMNAKAAELGLEHTTYADPHGLDDTNNLSCAHDLAVLGAYALDNEDFCRIVSTKKLVIQNSEGTQSRLLVNHNKLLRLYDGTVGIKTGYTKKSGRCLVSAAERNGVQLIAVTLGAPDDWNDHMAMFDYGFGLYERVTLADIGDESYIVPVVGGEAESVCCTNTDVLSVVRKIGDNNIRKSVELKRFCYAPINAGDVLGYVSYTIDGDEVGRIELRAESDVPMKAEKGMFERIAGFFKGLLGL